MIKVILFWDLLDKFDKNYIIAEIGSVHDGSYGNACKLIELAKKCGANMVKFQTHIAEAESTKDAPSPEYFKGESRYDYFTRTGFTKSQWGKLNELCAQLDIEFLSSPFSITAAELLNDIGIKKFKVPSGEITNIPLIEKLASYKKPVLISSGMSNWLELDRTVSLLIDRVDLCIMQCTSKYPCPPESVGLNVLSELKKRYNKKFTLGFSDHTSSIAAGIASAVLGARIIEKHLTFSKSMYGSDAKNALEPSEFSRYCQSIKEVWQMLDNPVDKNNLNKFKDMKLVFEKSIYAGRDLNLGDIIEFKDLSFKKPGDGISAAEYEKLIGLKLTRSIKYNQKLSWDYFE
mgnify:CR=1 FL=1